MKAILNYVLVVLLAGAVLPANGQDEPAPGPSAVTTSTPYSSVDELELRLAPLTLAELEAEAVAWREIVKAKASEEAEAAIAVKKAEAGSPEKASAEERFESAGGSRRELMERFGAVLTEWEAKGGDATEFRNYAKALSGVTLDVTDPEATASRLATWVKDPEGGLKWAGKIGVFAGIVIIAWMISSFVARLVEKTMSRYKHTSELLNRFVQKITRRGIQITGIIIGLSTLGVNVGALLALIGGASFIIGFAMQDSLSNFANGIMLLIYRPFDVGDVVEIGGTSGIVDSVSLVNTTIKTFDNKVILVPNKDVWGQTITNATNTDQRRVDMVFGIGYDDDVEKAQEILEKAVSEHELVLDDPKPTIRMHELADSSVNFICRPWVKTADYWTVHWDLIKRVKADFDAAGISIPYPQQDVHMHHISGDGGD